MTITEYMNFVLVFPELLSFLRFFSSQVGFLPGLLGTPNKTKGCKYIKA